MKRPLSSPTTSIAALSALLVLLVAAAALDADTFILRNGYSIDGKVVPTDPADPANAGVHVISIGDLGTLRIPSASILRLERNARTGMPAAEAAAVPAPARVEDLVVVHLKPDATRPRGGYVVGVLGKSDAAEPLVLGIPGVGALRVDRGAVERLEPFRRGAQAEPVPTSDGSRIVRTTHLVHLRNGEKIAGTVAAADGAETLTIDIGSIGSLTVPKWRVEKIDDFEGQIILPPEPVEEPAPEPAVAPPVLPPPPAPPAPAETGAAPEEEPRLLSAEEESEVLDLLYELSRQRSRNRVRAETRLRAYGDAAVPYLAEAVHDPFDLTRRAALRLIRDAASPAGVPLAIDVLNDVDPWVRQYAAEALLRATGTTLGYRPDASPRARLEAQRRWLDRFQERLAAGIEG